MQSNKQTNGTETTREEEEEEEAKNGRAANVGRQQKHHMKREYTRQNRNHGFEANNTGIAHELKTHHIKCCTQLAKLVDFVASFRVAAFVSCWRECFRVAFLGAFDSYPIRSAVGGLSLS